MNKKERNNILKKLKPQTWHAFCLIEAAHDENVLVSKAKLATELNISVVTLGKYMAIWESFGLMKTVPGGFCIAQLDGQSSGITGEVAPERKFSKAKDVIDLFCGLYEAEYGAPYNVSNWAMAQKQVKKLLAYSDVQIQGGVEAAIKLYATKWISAAYTRPSLGALTSWLFQQALPYAASAPVVEDADNGESVLNIIEEKGWFL